MVVKAFIKNKKRFFYSFLFFFLVLFSIIFLTKFSYSYETKITEQNILFLDNILINISLGNNFYLSSSANNVKVNLEFFPESNFNQEILELKTIPEAKNIGYAYEYKFGNLNQGNYKFLLNSIQKNRYAYNNITKKVDFPIEKENLPKEVLVFLIPTEKITIDENIKNKANELAFGEDDLFVVVFKIASWVNNNIEYSLTTKTAEASQNSSWVFENRYGVCDELTNLFISMCRSLGIPARFISGISYTNSELFTENWGLHGWAEVYFPDYGWIPFDPTYGQYGYLDSGHIKLKDSLDSDKSSTKYEWQSRHAELKPESFSFNVELLDIGKKIENPVEMNLKAYYDEISFGSYNLIELEIKNKLNNYLGFEVFLNAPKEINILEDETYYNSNEIIKRDIIYKEKSKKYIFLEPYEKKSVYWLIKVDDELLKRYIYSFPITAVSTFNYNKNTSFISLYDSKYYDYEKIKILKNSLEQTKEIYKKNLNVSCEYETLSYLNENLNIICSFENKGNLYYNKLRACIKNCTYFNLGINENKKINFTISSDKYGENNFTLLLTGKTYKYYLEDIPNITIENINVPDELEYKDFEISFEIWKHSRSNPKNVTIAFKFNDYEEKIYYDEIDSNKVVKIGVDKKVINFNNNINIKINYIDDKKENYKLKEIKFSKEIKLNKNKLYFIDFLIIKINNFFKKFF
ncbi:MAG: transglutaminase-like domain-containing protein [Candidatus Woesearchaeota archaeon]